jgi:hypothetical protein
MTDKIEIIIGVLGLVNKYNKRKLAQQIDALYSRDSCNSQTDADGKLRPEIVSKLNNTSNQKFITESQMLEKLNQFDTEEYKEALYYVQLGSATNGKTVIDELVKAIRAEKVKRITEILTDLVNDANSDDGTTTGHIEIASKEIKSLYEEGNQMSDKIKQVKEILNDAMTVHCKEARDFCDKFKDCQDCALHRIVALYSQLEKKRYGTTGYHDVEKYYEEPQPQDESMLLDRNSLISGIEDIILQDLKETEHKGYRWETAKDILSNCEPLIRADERKKIGELLEKHSLYETESGFVIEKDMIASLKSGHKEG